MRKSKWSDIARLIGGAVALLTHAAPALAHGQGGLVTIGVCIASLSLFLMVLLFLWAGYRRAGLTLLGLFGLLSILTPFAAFEWLAVGVLLELVALAALLAWWGGWKRTAVALSTYFAGVALAGFLLNLVTAALLLDGIISGEASRYAAIGIVVSVGGWLLATAVLLWLRPKMAAQVTSNHQ